MPNTNSFLPNWLSLLDYHSPSLLGIFLLPSTPEFFRRTTCEENLIHSSSDVELNVYDLHDLATVNNYTLHLGFGAFHTGVSVYGTEVSFGYPRGVYQVKPRSSKIGKFRMHFRMGKTSTSPQEVFKIIMALKYELNSSHFFIIITENNSEDQTITSWKIIAIIFVKNCVTDSFIGKSRLL